MDVCPRSVGDCVQRTRQNKGGGVAGVQIPSSASSPLSLSFPPPLNNTTTYCLSTERIMNDNSTQTSDTPWSNVTANDKCYSQQAPQKLFFLSFSACQKESLTLPSATSPLLIPLLTPLLQKMDQMKIKQKKLIAIHTASQIITHYPVPPHLTSRLLPSQPTIVKAQHYSIDLSIPFLLPPSIPPSLHPSLSSPFLPLHLPLPQVHTMIATILHRKKRR